MNRQLGSVEQYPQPIILYQRRGSLVMFIKIEEVLSGVYELTPYNKQVERIDVLVKCEFKKCLLGLLHVHVLNCNFDGISSSQVLDRS